MGERRIICLIFQARIAGRYVLVLCLKPSSATQRTKVRGSLGFATGEDLLETMATELVVALSGRLHYDADRLMNTTIVLLSTYRTVSFIGWIALAAWPETTAHEVVEGEWPYCHIDKMLKNVLSVVWESEYTTKMLLSEKLRLVLKKVRVC